MTNDDRLNEVLAAYLEAEQAGWAVSPEKILTIYPDLREDLVQFFDSRAALNRYATPLRNMDQTAATYPTMDGPALGVLGDFRLVREVGRGGMGIVYEAEQISLRRRVALKVLPFAAAIDPKYLQRFRNEAMAAAHLRHDHIVPVYAVGSERGVHYYAMQFIDGQSLAAVIDRFRGIAGPDDVTAPSVQTPTKQQADTPPPPKPSPRWAADLARQAALALEHAHQTGIIHRDIKPANLLLDPSGLLWVADFGLAQVSTDAGLTMTGEMLGTLRYASPEQALARPGLVDHRSDIYSLGATLYELLALRPMFDGADRHVLLHQISECEPPPLRTVDASLPRELETIVLKATAKELTDRYTSAQAFADDLTRFLEDRPIQARRPTFFERTVKWARRHRAIVTSAAAALALTIGGLTIAMILTTEAYERERKNANVAQRERERAEANFRQAKRAVDQFAAIGEQELAGQPPFEPVRKRLLEAALAYYEDFLAQHGSEPAERQDLEAGRAKVRALVTELTTLMGAMQYMALQHPEVQDELNLTHEQRAAFYQFDERWQESFRWTFRNGSVESERKRVTLAREQESQIAALLTPVQMQRFRQLTLQSRGAQAFLEAETANKLQLTAEQRKSVRAIVDARNLIAPRFGPPPGGGGGPKRGGGGPPRSEDRDALPAMLALLTPKQLEIWKSLIGEPFDRMPPPRERKE